MTIRPLPLTLAAILVAALPAAPAPALAQQSSVEYFTRSHSAALPQLLSSDDRAFYGSLFEAIDSRNWDRVEVMLAGRADGPLHGAALASYYLHPESPRIELGRIESWLDRYARLPEAEAIVRLGLTRGLENPPSLLRARDLVRQPGSTKRIRPSAINDGTMPESVKAAILERITNDDPDGARLLLDGVDATLSSQARGEWRYRVAWSYYIENQDAQAWALADTARDGGSGAWVAEGDWAAGLAAWRLGDCDKAAEAFQRSAAGAVSPNLAAAAHYWASRALIRCRFPEKADEQLRGAARFPETLYGMLAHEQMGRDLPRTHAQPDLTEADWRRLRDEEAARQAVMLAEIGRREEAERDLTWLVRTGDPDDYPALSRLARALGLTGAQTFMAYNAPRGEGAHPSLRYPVTFRTPVGGWRVDPALAFAHALQESNFRERVVSPAGAIGLMQIMPITQREYAASINMSSGADLKDPAVNLAFGQRTLESLGSSSYTQGRLPKVMAAYNAGPSPVSRWESEIRDQGDPLLYMESIPYWETRGYVAIVMRNYWMYLRQADAPAPSRVELAENDWPMFPGLR
ncbi:MAG: lytic transglycosylase domain-containing protein [Erythrobacter sp.]|jgi:soluble lytic murein transglycosylase|uniref:lytic transglycosylase domain-containing protein n=1 Tax=Qipengyuania citrea TaxID=225971 RepID=UPI001A47FD5C|nr:lytic transglycosylase domain-containing protein [Qipengyuania citrea]MBL4717591.1 lytic transglycosylase domain-containing protein [Erythrobacter sp.]MCP2016351.1 soluble lytic murein transglycosylase-like protein [Qipengyuania citrea]MDE0900419.1 lytic transglycosylase domain-containing protein [Erythrobacter sp.]